MLEVVLIGISLTGGVSALTPGTALAMNAAPVTDVRLGSSVVTLDGPWKFAVGDSPMDPTTGKLLWAEPGLDDSHWETVDLTPLPGATDPISGQKGYVAGWTSRGHAGYWGYGWYRMHLRIHARSGQKLALAGPAEFDNVYQVFANGELLGSFGDFAGRTPVTYYSQPMLFRLPQPGQPNAGQDDPGSSDQVLAFRVWMAPESLTTGPNSGGLHTAPVLGEATAVESGFQLRWVELVRAFSTSVVMAILFGQLAIVAFSLMLFDRSDRVYAWIGSVFLMTAAYYTIMPFGFWTRHVSILEDALFKDSLLTPLISGGWVMVWWVWFGRQRPRWMPWLAGGLVLLFMMSTAVGKDLFFGFVPEALAADSRAVSLVVRLLLFAPMLWIAVQGIRREGLEGWLVLPAVLLRGVAVFQTELYLLHIKHTWHPFGATVGPPTPANLLLAGELALLLLRRLLKSVKAQRLLALDVKQAQEVQKVILPEAKVDYPGLVIESVYRPAREVGGDFFQVIPNAEDGSLLIVAGDVAGKGLQAGMLVALLVGAIRIGARFNPDPQVVLHELNQCLMGRGDAAATCLAMRIAIDGRVTLANAGHVPPYLNGAQVAMEGALPLGMFAWAECSVMHFMIEPSDTLMLMSDGILEAMDGDGQLFGFDRIQALMDARTSAVGIADAAQKFGQEDDISVISVERVPVLAHA